MTVMHSHGVTTPRERALRAMLEARRREVLGELQAYRREARSDGTTHGVSDEGERWDTVTQRDIAAARRSRGADGV